VAWALARAFPFCSHPSRRVVWRVHRAPDCTLHITDMEGLAPAPPFYASIKRRTPLLETLALILAVLTYFGCVLILQRFAAKLHSIQEKVESIERGRVTPALAAVDAIRPLEGLRIGLAVTQDHAHPVFATLLKEQLLKEDALEVNFLTPEEAAALQADWPKGQIDILISGKLTCNGYAEIYYDADFTCFNAHEPICTLVERPPHGDRPSNLAMELVARLNTGLTKLLSRTERREALKELGGP